MSYICNTGEVAANYQDYLKTNHWRKTSEAIKEQANNKCSECGAKGVKLVLSVHHLSYKNIGHESDCDLVCLCDACHKEVHNIIVTYNNRELSKKAINRGERTLRRLKENRARIIEIFENNDNARDALTEEFNKTFARKIMKTPMFKKQNKQYKEPRKKKAPRKVIKD